MDPPSYRQIHVLVMVPKQESCLWLVSGTIENALDTKGIHRNLYRLAASRFGRYDPACRKNDKDVAFWYEDKKLRFHVPFKKEKAALQFNNDLAESTLTLGLPLRDQIITREFTRVKGVPTDLKCVMSTGYDPQESDSPQHTISSVSLTTSVSILDSLTDEFRYQRIEHESFFPFGKAESCHLVSRKQSRDYKRKFAKYDRDPNRRLALSREMYGYYNGINFEIPIVNMLPGLVEKSPSIGSKYKVEVLVKVFDANCIDSVFYRLKDGSTKTDDPLVMKTFVHVENPETFCFCMRWKHNYNEEHKG